jgi:hypothetical protein
MLALRAMAAEGAVRTRFLANSELHKPADNGGGPYAVYQANVDTMTARAHRDGARGVPDPDDVARVIVTAVTARRPRARYKVGSQDRLAPACAERARRSPVGRSPPDRNTLPPARTWRSPPAPPCHTPSACTQHAAGQHHKTSPDPGPLPPRPAAPPRQNVSAKCEHGHW